MGEREKDVSVLSKSVHRILGRRLEVFIPAVTQKFMSEQETTFYMDGYVFVLFEEGVNYLKLQDTTYFSSVLIRSRSLSASRRPEYSLLQDSDLDPMRAGMKSLLRFSFQVGDPVKLVSGQYKGLSGVVRLVYDGGEKVQISVPTGSKPILMDCPTSMLSRIRDENP
jgi:transcription antitermination factor NusG